MREVSGDDEAVGTHERLARGADAFLTVGCEGELGGAGVAAVEGPFCFAVADYEDAGVGHCLRLFGMRDVGVSVSVGAVYVGLRWIQQGGARGEEGWSWKTRGEVNQ